MNLKNLLAFSAAILAVSAHGQTLVTSVGGLGANDQIAWGALGTGGTTVPQPFFTTSVGLTDTTSVSAAGNFERLDQGIGWNGNFAGGATLLWNQGNGPVTLTFSSILSGAGFQIENDQFGPFNATIQAYGAGNSFLGSATEAGNSQPTGDNSAIFIGILNPGISSIVISTSTPGANNFAIGNVALNVAPVPEPSTFALAGLAISAFCVYRQRK